jgi:xanthine/uracil permease
MFKKNANQYLALVAIALSIIVAGYFWHQTRKWQLTIIQSDSWYSLPELSRTEIRDAYDLAFKKIFLIDAIIFTSTFLWLKVREK